MIAEVELGWRKKKKESVSKRKGKLDEEDSDGT